MLAGEDSPSFAVYDMALPRGAGVRRRRLAAK